MVSSSNHKKNFRIIKTHLLLGTDNGIDKENEGEQAVDVTGLEDDSDSEILREVSDCQQLQMRA